VKRALSRVWRRRLFFSNALGQAHRGGVMSNTEEQRSTGSAAKHERAVRTVTRADLSETVYRRVGLSRSESAELVQEFLDEICDAAARGETVKLSSFGSFVVRSKSERIGRNPKTGVEVPILPRRVMVFKPSNVLKARINGVSAPDEN
jgi:integration host factor subunit alpha